MANIEATISELEAAAKKISEACEQYRNAANNLKAAADNLAATWEGDSQVAFSNEQQKANAWYLKMAETAQNYAAELSAAAIKYGDTDHEAAGTIGAR